MIVAAALSSLTVLALFAGSAGSTTRSVRSPLLANATAAPLLATPRAAWPRHLLSATAAGAALIIVGPLMTTATAVGVFAWPRLRSIQSARAHRRDLVAALPDTIELLVLVMHAGLTPHQAMVLLAERAPLPTRPAFVEVTRRTSRGAPLADALHALPELLGVGATSVADTLSLAERHGTPITHALEQLSFEVRERRQRQSEAAARQLPIRLAFPLVTCTLPSFVLIAIVPAVLGALASLDASGL